MKNTFLLAKKLREKILKRDSYACVYCKRQGNDKQMGIGPVKDNGNGYVSLHEKCNDGYYKKAPIA